MQDELMPAIHARSPRKPRQLLFNVVSVLRLHTLTKSYADILISFTLVSLYTAFIPSNTTDACMNFMRQVARNNARFLLLNAKNKTTG